MDSGHPRIPQGIRFYFEENLPIKTPSAIINSMKPVLVSGIKPSGQLHLGNYLGALKNFIDLQNSGKYNCYFFVADLHAITEPQNPKELHDSILSIAASYIAAGMDAKKVTFFLQSLVHAHSELAWILNTITPIGELNRMTQFKEKGEKVVTRTEEIIQRDGIEIRTGKTFTKDTTQLINVGLFDYPVLMAGDVLLYDATVVPVGDDQLQHLELTRTLARKFNSRFGKMFIEPKGLLTKTPRVRSLKDPAKKMSKSQPEGCLFLDDSPEEIRAKISRAVTDSNAKIEYDPERKPGLSNLLDIYAALDGGTIAAPTGKAPEPKEIAREFAGKTYSEFKKSLAELVADYFVDFRMQKEKLLAKPATLVKILNDGSARAAKVADAKMAEVKKKVGLAI